VRPSSPAPAALAACLLLLLAAPARAQWPPDSLTNLQVLPADISVGELTRLMAGFTRALGVRCSTCHLGEETQPLAEYDFASDDKELKRKAREMLRMVEEINGRHLSALPARRGPEVRVGCFTCHRGVRVPRTLQEELLIAYDEGGLAGLRSRYDVLREDYHGRAAYDFADVALADVGAEIQGRGALADAEAVHALNVERNPGEWFAQWRHFDVAVLRAFTEDGVEAGVDRYRELRARYDPRAVQEIAVDQTGRALLRQGRIPEAAALLGLNAEAHPDSPAAHLGLGEARQAAGDAEAARRSYLRVLELAPDHEGAMRRLAELGGAG
jgi:tetratricopeptide (TPR) repeat protein